MKSILPCIVSKSSDVTDTSQEPSLKIEVNPFIFTSEKSNSILSSICSDSSL